ncbi:hypothetical protein PIB30_053139 [Stylosanthes scabra]|uniref:Uncharacterized protein n=1 Tax=Stylosanthes scabra TaxID=79078 RepID=A0ABU6QI73_9FABA|nr:hypothetical protein [Stylosanthes scabra]
MVVTDGHGVVRWIRCCSRCCDEFESGDRLTICYKWSVIRSPNLQTSKPHKASAPSLFFLLFIEMFPPIPNLLTVSDKGYFFPFYLGIYLKRIENYMPSSGASYLHETDLSDGKSEIEGWDIIEHLKFPPSQSEDIGLLGTGLEQCS